MECRIAKENLFHGRVEASVQVQNRKSMKLAMPFLKVMVIPYMHLANRLNRHRFSAIARGVKGVADLTSRMLHDQ